MGDTITVTGTQPTGPTNTDPIPGTGGIGRIPVIPNPGLLPRLEKARKNPETIAEINERVLKTTAMAAIPLAGAHSTAATWGFTYTSGTAGTYLGLKELSATISKSLDKAISKSLPVLGRMAGVAGLLFYPNTSIMSQEDEMRELNEWRTAYGAVDNAHRVVVTAADIISRVPEKNIPQLSAVESHFQMQSVIDIKTDKQIIAATPAAGKIPVVKAVKTDKPDVFKAQIVPGMPAFHIRMDSTDKKPATPVPEPAKSLTATQYLTEPAANTHQAFVWFEGAPHIRPVYVSVSKILSEAEQKAQAEEAKKREQKALTEQEKALIAAEQELHAAVLVLTKAQADENLHKFAVVAAQKAYDVQKAEYDDWLRRFPSGFVKLNPITPLNIHNVYGSKTKAREAELNEARHLLAIAVESRKQAEGKKKAAEDKVKEAKDKKGKTPELKFDDKIKKDMRDRSWTEQDIKDTVAKGPTGKSVDQRRPVKTEDGLGRNDPATVYGKPGEYVVINDRTGEVTQVSDKKDLGWMDDSRIQWEKK
ncbi:hypothetical protein KV921_004488 [Escherichia coli]|nr:MULTISPECIES: colicin E5-related ribonuclease [Enterobacterales]EFJ3386273.1 hypothetical protein [Escherichia coli]EFJ3482518.1 hypothetical protein [Escherichia coli]EFP5534854.1 hypothetical protein [Escherichia coli]EFP5560266.1 hypothetical protein [Escherichia coli]EHS6058884.1 hypothetical protein [Escherichia coli]